MSEPDLVLWVLKFVIKRQSVIILNAFALAIMVLKKLVVVEIGSELGGVVVLARDVILEVLDVIAAALPAILVLEGVGNLGAVFCFKLFE